MRTSNQIHSESSILILIDLQGRLMPAINQGESVLNQCIRIAKIAQLLGIPIIGTEQSPKSLGSNIESIKSFCSQTISKEHFNACADGLAAAIPTNRQQCILMGCEAHVCLMQTALKLIDEGYDVSIVVDGVGSRRALDKQIALDRLSAAGARLITGEMLGFEWLKSAQNPAFKEALALLK
ncbi:isochorismatase family protein [Polynucleobacter sp. AP-Jannik-300A-C4]|uniref:isochorismatase family protein n=1 Tax=Polynucleobacter sp. AP-Jannik-300A-C4 TaxID=2576928 RepID=UPI001BFCF71A|nr:isochorismatase family protein [Polynucleobacter sp. AP-Jannik-300A-C4]QWE23002.1 isochorismatase family protein [Polynucleobacter sp. AP-Jannik-300A-C4]